MLIQIDDDKTEQRYLLYACIVAYVIEVASVVTGCIIFSSSESTINGRALVLDLVD